MKITWHFLQLVFFFRQCEATHEIDCVLLSYEKVKTSWYFEPVIPNKEASYFVVSWFNKEDYDAVSDNTGPGYRSDVESLYENEVYRYNYDVKYEHVLEDVAASLGLAPLNYQLVKENHLVITEGIKINHTLDIAVRRIFEETDQRPETSEPAEILHCTILVQRTDQIPGTSEYFLESWAWFVIVPGSLLILVSSVIVVVTLSRFFRKVRSKSRVGLIASSWREESDSGDLGRHWVLPQRSCTPFSAGGTSVDYTQSFASGGSDVWEKVYRRHSLTTVMEESDVEGQWMTEVSRPRDVFATHQPGYGHRRISTPQACGVELWATRPQSSRLSASGTTSLWWPDDETELNDDAHFGRSRKTFSRERKYRRVAPLEKVVVANALDEEQINLLRAAVNKAPSETSLAMHRTVPGKKKLRVTSSTMNVLLP